MRRRRVHNYFHPKKNLNLTRNIEVIQKHCRLISHNSGVYWMFRQFKISENVLNVILPHNSHYAKNAYVLFMVLVKFEANGRRRWVAISHHFLQNRMSGKSFQLLEGFLKPRDMLQGEVYGDWNRVNQLSNTLTGEFSENVYLSREIKTNLWKSYEYDQDLWRICNIIYCQKYWRSKNLWASGRYFEENCGWIHLWNIK